MNIQVYRVALQLNACKNVNTKIIFTFNVAIRSLVASAAPLMLMELVMAMLKLLLHTLWTNQRYKCGDCNQQRIIRKAKPKKCQVAVLNVVGRRLR